VVMTREVCAAPGEEGVQMRQMRQMREMREMRQGGLVAAAAVASVFMSAAVHALAGSDTDVAGDARTVVAMGLAAAALPLVAVLAFGLLLVCLGREVLNADDGIDEDPEDEEAEDDAYGVAYAPTCVISSDEVVGLAERRHAGRLGDGGTSGCRTRNEDKTDSTIYRILECAMIAISLRHASELAIPENTCPPPPRLNVTNIWFSGSEFGMCSHAMQGYVQHHPPTHGLARCVCCWGRRNTPRWLYWPCLADRVRQDCGIWRGKLFWLTGLLTPTRPNFIVAEANDKGYRSLSSNPRTGASI
jgi:hypothetical protein